MIYQTLHTLSNRLNVFFKNRFAQTENITLLSNLIQQDGTVALMEENRIVIQLINVEKETTTSVMTGGKRQLVHGAAHPAVHLNLYVMFSAYFTGKNYGDGLKFLSAVISFFQSYPVLDRHSTPELGTEIEKISLEMISLDLQTMSNIWSMIGGKQLPSVIYKVRMLTFQEGTLISEIPVIKQLNRETK